MYYIISFCVVVSLDEYPTHKMFAGMQTRQKNSILTGKYSSVRKYNLLHFTYGTMAKVKHLLLCVAD